MRYRNILHRHKKYQFRITINLVDADMIEIANSILIIETYFYMMIKRINIGQFAIETLGSLFTGFRHERYIIIKI